VETCVVIARSCPAPTSYNQRSLDRQRSRDWSPTNNRVMIVMRTSLGPYIGDDVGDVIAGVKREKTRFNERSVCVGFLTIWI